MTHEPKDPPAAEGEPPTDPAPAPQGPWYKRRPELRRRVALLVLVVGIAGLVAYWARNKPVEVTVIYDFGRLAPRVTRITLSYSRQGHETQPVDITFPERAPKRYRHVLRLIPGPYTIRARVFLRATADREAEVKRHTRRVTIATGKDQRFRLRFSR